MERRIRSAMGEENRARVSAAKDPLPERRRMKRSALRFSREGDEFFSLLSLKYH